MKKLFSAVLLLSMLAVSLLGFSSSASAEEIKMVGTVTKIELAADGKSAVATLKDNKTDESVAIIVTDELTLDKFKEKKIVEGDEIRAKYDKQNGKNMSKTFKKTAGC